MINVRPLALIHVAIALSFCSGISADEPSREDRVRAGRERARQYAREHRTSLGIADPDKQLGNETVSLLDRGAIVSFQQLHEGLRVYGGLLVITSVEDRVMVTNSLVRAIKVVTKPRVTSDAAIDFAVKHVGFKGPVDPAEVELIVMPAGSVSKEIPAADTLAWQVSVHADNQLDGPKSFIVYVNAATGEMIHSEDERRDAAAPYLQGWGDMKGMYYSSRPEVVMKSNTAWTKYTFYMRDPCYGTGYSVSGYSTINGVRYCAHTTNYGGKTSWAVDHLGQWVGDANGSYTDRGAPLEISQSNVFGDGTLTSNNPRTPAADAYFSLYRAMNYLEVAHNRLGVDGNNVEINALVRVGIGANATWTG